MENSREPVGHKSIPHRSPIHVYQLMMQLLREYLLLQSRDPQYPFFYSDKYEETNVTIDTTFNKESEIYGKKPSILVSRGGINTQPLVIGDLASQPSPMFQHLKLNTTLVNSSVAFKILDRSSAGADLLGTEIFNFLVMARTVFPKIIPVQTVQSMDISSVATLKEDDHMYFCDAQMAYTMQYKWSVHKETELLRGYNLHMKTTNRHNEDSDKEDITRDFKPFTGKEN